MLYKNLNNFPYVREVHFERDISELKRVDVSYAEYYVHQEGNLKNSPEINNYCIGLPFKTKDDIISRNKTEYHDVLFK